jgi:hypothetical protein
MLLKPLLVRLLLLPWLLPMLLDLLLLVLLVLDQLLWPGNSFSAHELDEVRLTASQPTTFSYRWFRLTA